MNLDLARAMEAPAVLSLAKEQSIVAALRGAERKALQEAIPVAMLAIALYQLSGERYLVKIIDPIEQTPDIALVPAGISQEWQMTRRQQPVEVVTFTPYSKIHGLFLLQTKLAPEYSYPDNYFIVCHITLPVDDPWQACANMARVFAEQRVARHPIFLFLI